MTTLKIILIIVLWLALGIHSAFYLVKEHTKRFDFTANEVPMLIACILLPIITHIATFMTFREWNKINDGESKTLWKKRKD